MEAIQALVKGWLAEAGASERLTAVGAYRAF
jgi:hypothetical protein